MPSRPWFNEVKFKVNKFRILKRWFSVTGYPKNVIRTN
jgi:hypothetical protein